MALDKDIADVKVGAVVLRAESPAFNSKVQYLFRLMAEKGASDLFLTANAPPKLRIEGQIFQVNNRALSAETVRQWAFGLMTPEHRERFQRELELDFAFSEDDLGRFRVSVFMQRGTPAMVMRYITPEVPRLEHLGLPELLARLVMEKRGLVLIAGGSGSGKSTSAAAMIDLRNENSSAHIMTIEDPIEFLHANKRSIVNQREVGRDTKTLTRALRGVVRAVPDLVLIGDIRSRETLEAAVSLAAGGHLVLTTMQASSCAESVDRIINMFPGEQHPRLCHDLSQYLRAILAQRLVKGSDSRRRVAAMETMLNTPTIAELIRGGDIAGLREAVAAEGERGIQSFDTSLYHLYREGRIELAEALSQAESRANLEARINLG